MRRKGSPPRGRGKVEGAIKGCLCDGITPAWAGKSSAGYSLGLQMEDHPRVGGEKWRNPLMAVCA